MEVLCKKCNVATVAKEVKSGPRGPWTAYECHNGCENDQGYKLTTSPPRKGNGYQKPSPVDNKLQEQMVNLLTAILQELQIANDPLNKQI